MKKVKALLAMVTVCTILVGSFSGFWVDAKSDITSETQEVIILNDPLPSGH